MSSSIKVICIIYHLESLRKALNIMTSPCGLTDPSLCCENTLLWQRSSVVWAEAEQDVYVCPVKDENTWFCFFRTSGYYRTAVLLRNCWLQWVGPPQHPGEPWVWQRLPFCRRKHSWHLCPSASLCTHVWELHVTSSSVKLSPTDHCWNKMESSPARTSETCVHPVLGLISYGTNPLPIGYWNYTRMFRNIFNGTGAQQRDLRWT